MVAVEPFDAPLLECIGSIGGSRGSILNAGHVGDFLSGDFSGDFSGDISIVGNLVGSLDKPVFFDLGVGKAGKFATPNLGNIGGNLVESFSVTDDCVLAPVPFGNTANVGSFDIALVTSFLDVDSAVLACFSNGSDALLGSDGSVKLGNVLETLDDTDGVLLRSTTDAAKFGDLIANGSLGASCDVSDNLLGTFGTDDRLVGFIADFVGS